VDRGAIGTELLAHSVRVERERVTRFRQAIGDRDTQNELVPLTLFFGLDLDGEPHAKLSALGVDLTKVLHGEQTFTYHGPAAVGDTLQLVTRIGDVYEKHNGALQFIVLDTTVIKDTGEPVVDMRCVMVVKHGSRG
jgi:hypothetical protein